MLNNIGRLDEDSIKELDQYINTIFEYLDSGKKEEAKEKISSMARTQNYFIREYFGRHLLDYHNQRKILSTMRKMLKSEYYGERATAIFYFYAKYFKEPNKIIDVIEKVFENTPWETENILNDLWKYVPTLMKKRMKEWSKSDNEMKRALSFHGMENIVNSDPEYIMEFISNTIGDKSFEVQKKITHILTQVAKIKPIIVYPYIREWLVNSTEAHEKTIWVSMKKLANIMIQKSKRDKTQDFIILTEQTIKDWSLDPNEKISKMGKKLYAIIKYDSKNNNHKSNSHHSKRNGNNRSKNNHYRK